MCTELVKFGVEVTIVVWAWMIASFVFTTIAYTWWLEDLRKRNKEKYK